MSHSHERQHRTPSAGPRQRRKVQVCAIGCGMVLLGQGIMGCSQQPSSPTLVEFAAVQQIDYAALPPGMNKLLEDLFSDRILGRSLDAYEPWDSLQASKEMVGDDECLTVRLPENPAMKERFAEDPLVHFPVLLLRTESKTNLIKAARLIDFKF